MLRIYRAPDGRTFQYEEGKQPKGFVLDEPKGSSKRAAAKRRAPSPNKAARKPADKGAE